MKLVYRAALAAVALTAASPALSATISNKTGVVEINAAPGLNLNNSRRDGTVYLVNEGTVNGITSYLLHYGRGLLDDYANNGGFTINLGANEVLDRVVTSTAGLNATDRSGTGVVYSNDAFRGLEAPSVLFYGDALTNTGINPINVTFQLRTSVASSDEARFIIRSVPEPSTWAMMIGGFGLVGFGMRRRAKTSVRYA